MGENAIAIRETILLQDKKEKRVDWGKRGISVLDLQQQVLGLQICTLEASIFIILSAAGEHAVHF